MDDWDHWANADDGPQVFGGAAALAREEYETRPTHPVCAWCAGTLGDVTREMRWGQASPPTYLCPEHEAKWDDVQRRATAAMSGGRELFRVQAGTGVMRGFAKSLSVSMDAAIALGLVEDPRPAAIDAMDQERWRLLQELGRQNSDGASRTIEGKVVQVDGEVSEIPGPTPASGDAE